MADWKQITARIRRARTGKDPAAQLSALYEKTQDAMVAFGVGARVRDREPECRSRQVVHQACSHALPSLRLEKRKQSRLPRGLAAANPLETRSSIFRSSRRAFRFPKRARRSKTAPLFLTRLLLLPPNPAPRHLLKLNRKVHRKRRAMSSPLKPQGNHPRAKSNPLKTAVVVVAGAGDAIAARDGALAAQSSRSGTHSGTGHSRSESSSAPASRSHASSGSAESAGEQRSVRSSESSMPRLPVEAMPAATDAGGIALRGRYGDPGLSSRLSSLEVQFRRLLTCSPIKLDELERASLPGLRRFCC